MVGNVWLTTQTWSQVSSRPSNQPALTPAQSPLRPAWQFRFGEFWQLTPARKPNGVATSCGLLRSFCSSSPALSG